MLRKYATLLIISLMTGTAAFASHISGGEIVYTCLGNNMYEVSLILYRDCDGINMQNTEVIDFNSPCGTETLTVNLTNPPNGTEVSQLCPSQIQLSTCNGGSLPGMQAYIYTGVVTLAPCDSWTMGWDDCCRNGAILNLTNPNALDSYVEATMNNLDFPCNDSPTFTALPIPYVCQNQPVNFSYGAIDPEGDSLNYTLVTAMEAGGTPTGYVVGYTPTFPVPGATINQFTGLLSFTPMLIGNFVFVVLIEQFDDQGNLIGTIMRDMQFVVIACSNIQPNPNDGDISNFTGTALQDDSMSVVMCASGTFCFDFTISDPDVGDTLTLTTNVDQVLPGATMTYTGINPVSGTICWSGVGGSSGLNSFLITANDGQCPIPGIQSYVYDVFVLQATGAGPDQILCGPLQTAQLDAFGGTVFNWTALPGGDPIVVGQNFSCNPCEQPIADPNVTTTYVVTSNLTGNCSNIDTVTVFVVPDFTFTATQTDTLICLGEVVDFDVTIPGGGAGYTYLWTPDVGLSNPNIANPTGIYSNPGTYSYVVDITSADGCSHQDTTLTVVVSPGYIPLFNIDQSDSIVCMGESAQLSVTLDCTLPAICGTYSGPCCGPISTTDVGTDTQSGTTTTFPAIYGHFWEGAKHQILYRASELQALSFSGGLISEIGFEIAALNGTNQYFGWEIKMGCTTLDELNQTSWVTGLTSVYYSDTINIQAGWNTYPFAESFNWDGSSNLVIEVCWNNDVFLPGFTQNSPVYFTPTTYNSVAYFNADNTPGLCDLNQIDAVSQDRPNTRMVYCGGINQNDLAFQWSPSGDFSDPNASTTTVTPTSAPTTYTVTVGELGSGCTASASVNMDWHPDPNVFFTPTPDEGVFPFTPTFVNGSDPSVNGFNWDFAGLGNSNDQDPQFTFNDPGVYYITLFGTDVNGCTGSYTDSILVLLEPIVEIPNVFSPNGDGQNDFLAFLQFQGFKNFKMIIMNRWGNTVHETSSVGGDLRVWRPDAATAEGTYFYIFTGTGTNDKPFEEHGHITLVR